MVLAVGLLGLVASAPVSSEDSEMIGYYSWNWGSGSVGPSEATFGVAFTGLVDVELAIAGYDAAAGWCCPRLNGERFLCIGGGNAAGQFDLASLRKVHDDLHLVKAANYSGVVFDVEIVIGAAEKLVPAFAAAFEQAKMLGLKVIVTMSHSAPYSTDTPVDAVSMVKAWVTDKNIDALSPQLYSSGSEVTPEFAETYTCKAAGCKWDLFENSIPKFVPSIVDQEQYKAVKAFYAGAIEVGGYIQWHQVPPSPTSIDQL